MADTKDEVAEPEQGGGKMKLIMMGGAGLVLLAIGIFAGPAIQNMISPPADESSAEAEVAEKASGPELYQTLHPALIVNFKDEFGEPHYMQIEMQVMARDQDTINAIRDHTPLIRNNLILLYSTANYEFVTTREGKEKMLADGLAVVRDVLEPRIKTPNAEALYFTSLIIQ
ncbi:MAG: flagellar basal body-associated FliL family protein [Woeseia sp.]